MGLLPTICVQRCIAQNWRIPSTGRADQTTVMPCRLLGDRRCRGRGRVVSYIDGAGRLQLSYAEKQRKLYEERLAAMQKQKKEQEEFMAQHQDQIMAAMQAVQAQAAAAKENDKSRAFSAREAAKARASSNANSAASRALSLRAQDIGRDEFAQSQAFREKQRKDSLRESAQARLDRNSSDRDAKMERQFNTPGQKRIRTGVGTYRMVDNDDPDYKDEQHVSTEIEKRKKKRRKDKNFIRYF